MPQLLDQPITREEQRASGSLFWKLVACVGIFVLYGLFTRYQQMDTGIRSGAPPIYSWWRKPAFIHRPLAALFYLPPIVMFLGWRWFIRRQVQRPMSDARLLAMAVGFFFTFNIAVCLMAGGPNPGELQAAYPHVLYEIVRPFNYPGVEFTTDVYFVASPAQFLHDYVSLHGVLALHSRTHPPGPVLFLWGVQKALGYRLMPMALAAIAVTALSVIPAFLTARRLYGRQVATIAIGLMGVTPSLVLYGATSMDGVYMLPLLTSVYLFVAATQARSNRAAAGLAIGLGVTMVIASLMTFATSCLGVLFGVYAALAWLRLRQWRRVWGVLCLAAVVFAAIYLALQQTTGYNLLACVKVSMHSDSEVMGARAASLRRYFDVSIADLAAFLVGAGFLVTLLLAGQVRQAVNALLEKRQFDPMLVAFAATIVLLSFSTLFRWETERIWVFMIPLAVFAAARYIAGGGHTSRGRPDTLLRFSLLALFVQTYLMQMFLFTLW